jgi:hypothetical protein
MSKQARWREDCPGTLNERGQKQAEALGEALKGVPTLSEEQIVEMKWNIK